MPTTEEKFWTSGFGDSYMKRNSRSNKELDSFYLKNLGVTRSKINTDFVTKLKLDKTLEVGCNLGDQLKLLQAQGLKNLYGIDVNSQAIETAKKRTKFVSVLPASGFDIPYKDRVFDLVFTSGVLIHINPKDIQKIMKEIHRTSKKYIWGVEYYHPEYINIDYRGNKKYLWKGNFAKMFLDHFPDLVLVKEKRYEKIPGNIWTSYLLKKQ